VEPCPYYIQGCYFADRLSDIILPNTFVPKKRYTEQNKEKYTSEFCCVLLACVYVLIVTSYINAPSENNLCSHEIDHMLQSLLLDSNLFEVSFVILFCL